jgi:hypothetical protein
LSLEDIPLGTMVKGVYAIEAFQNMAQVEERIEK